MEEVKGLVSVDKQFLDNGHIDQIVRQQLGRFGHIRDGVVPSPCAGRTSHSSGPNCSRSTFRSPCGHNSSTPARQIASALCVIGFGEKVVFCVTIVCDCVRGVLN